MELSAASVTLDMALDIAATARAPFVSHSESRFNGELLRTLVAEEGELPQKVVRVITQASSHEGAIEELTLQWPAHGLIFKWVAEADRHEHLWDLLSEATAEESQESDKEMAEQQKIHNAHLRKFEIKLAASREFRGASVQKRRAIAESVAGSISDDLVDSWGGRMAITEAGRAAKRAAYEYELILSSQVADLVAQLAAREDWPSAATISVIRDLTAKLLIGKADGYRLSTAFVNEVAQLAFRSKY